MPTIDDLRRQLADDVTTIRDSPDRLGLVHHRVALGRRRRAMASGLVAVAVLLAAGAVLPQLGNGGERVLPGEPTPSASTALPTYMNGGRLIAEATHAGGDAFTVPFTPDSRKLMFSVDCFVDGVAATADDPPMAEFSVAGSPIGAASCGSAAAVVGPPSSTFTPDPGALAHLSPGKPSQLRVSVDRDVPASSRVRIGIYELVPVADYPFPPQPDPLPGLEVGGNLSPSLHEDPLLLLSSAELPADVGSVVQVEAVGSTTRTLTIDKKLTIDGLAVAPGTITVKAGGKTVYRFSSWDYNQQGFGASVTLDELGIPGGGDVEVTVTAERFPGPSWAILLSDGR